MAWCKLCIPQKSPFKWWTFEINKKKKREMTAVKEVLMTSLFLSFNFYAKEKIMILKAQTAVLFVHAQHTKKELVTDSGG